MNLAPLSNITRRFLATSGIVLGLAATAPVQAADNVQLGFSFGTGNSSFSLSIGNGGYIGRHFAPPPPRQVCMTEMQMRNRLRAQGYRFIVFGDEYRGWVHISARRMGQGYTLDMNRCTGAVANSAAAGGWGGTGGPGFGFGSNPMPGGFNSGFGSGPGFNR